MSRDPFVEYPETLDELYEGLVRSITSGAYIATSAAPMVELIERLKAVEETVDNMVSVVSQLWQER
jgi:hypothetical protein